MRAQSRQQRPLDTLRHNRNSHYFRQVPGTRQ